MKHMKQIGLVALVAGLMSTACVDPITPVEHTPENAPVTRNLYSFTATLEAGMTKTGLGANGLSVVWKEGDKIKVFNASTPAGEVYTLSAGAGTPTGTFTGEPLSGSGTYYAVYPSSAVDGNITSTITLQVPSVQEYAENSFGPGANLAMATGDALENISFRNIGGALKLSLRGSHTIKAVNLYTRGDELFCGKVTIGNLSGEPTITYNSSVEQGGHLTLDCGAGVALDPTESKDFYLILPSGVLGQGYQVEIIDSEGKATLKTAKASDANKIERSVIRPMPAFEYKQVYNADFLTTGSLAGAWTGVGKDYTLVKCAECTVESGQYAIVPGGTDDTFRIQDWTAGYAVSVTFPNSLSLGSTYDGAVSVLGDAGGITDNGSARLKVIKGFAGRIWLLDETTGNGYIIR